MNKENLKFGWISLQRSIMKHWVFDNPKDLKWWLIMLMEVNHSPSKYKLGNALIDINSGQSCKSLRTWANLFKVSTKTVKKFFNLLESDGMITTKTVGKGKQSSTLVTIINYNYYQGAQETLNTTQEKREVNLKGTQTIITNKKEKNNNERLATLEVLFKNSKYNNYENVRDYLLMKDDYKERYKGADLKFYIQGVLSWSIKKQNKLIDESWMGYIMSFMDDDIKKGELVMRKKKQISIKERMKRGENVTTDQWE